MILPTAREIGQPRTSGTLLRVCIDPSSLGSLISLIFIFKEMLLSAILLGKQAPIQVSPAQVLCVLGIIDEEICTEENRTAETDNAQLN